MLTLQAASFLDNLGAGLGILGAGTAAAVFGAIVTMREGRQKRYDERVDGENARLRTRNDDLEVENDRLAEDVSRLRRLCYDHGIDPDKAAT